MLIKGLFWYVSNDSNIPYMYLEISRRLMREVVLLMILSTEFPLFLQESSFPHIPRVAMVFGMRHKNAEERRKSLGLMTLEQRRERGDLIEVFKILKGHTKIDPSIFWEVRDARNGARLVKSRATNGKRQRQNFFSYRVIQKWNLLPANVKMSPSLDSFKSRLDAMIMKEE